MPTTAASSASAWSWVSGSVAAASLATAAVGATVLCEEGTEPLAWGWNQYGQLGLGTEADVSSPTVIEFLKNSNVRVLKSSGPANSSAAITSAGELYTFGCGKDSRLGHGETIDAPNQTIPKKVEGFESVHIEDVAVGEYHMAVITDDGDLWTFGKNRAGQLGHANPSPGRPAKVPAAWSGRVADVACGRQHTVIVDSAGEAYSWGFGADGALGHGVKTNERAPKRIEALVGKKLVAVECGREFTAFLTETGEVYACGLDGNGQLGTGFAARLQRKPQRVKALDGKHIVKLVCGENHAVALDDGGQVYTWGWGSHGQLGHGDRNDLGIPRHVAALSGDKIVGGAAGGAHTMLVTDKGKVYAFGRGRNGQLGRDNHLESIAAYRTEPLEIDLLSSRDVLSLSAGDSHSLAVVR